MSEHAATIELGFLTDVATVAAVVDAHEDVLVQIGI